MRPLQIFDADDAGRIGLVEQQAGNQTVRADHEVVGMAGGGVEQQLTGSAPQAVLGGTRRIDHPGLTRGDGSASRSDRRGNPRPCVAASANSSPFSSPRTARRRSL